MIVAEIGLNHMGDETIAMRMLRKLVKRGIDAVTFQIANPSFYNKDKPYKKALRSEFYRKAIDYVHENGKLIGFAIADKSMVRFLNDSGADFWKTLSQDLSNYDLHSELQKTEKVTYVSTGLSCEKEITRMSNRLKTIILIHTEISHRIEDVNLKAISRLGKCTGRKVAFGLHCSDISSLYLAVAFEPSDIFFYVKEDLKISYPDDQHAISITNLNSVLTKITKLRKALGNGAKEKRIN